MQKKKSKITDSKKSWIIGTVRFHWSPIEQVFIWGVYIRSIF